MKQKSNGNASFFSEPTRVICVSFCAVILLGAALLALPISSKAGVWTPALDTLFTATSATCVTGLIVYDTFLYWSRFGQGVILALIQVGGLGLVTFVSFFAVVARQRLGFKGMQLAQESTSAGGFQDIRRIVKKVVTITFGVEAVGALLLAAVFVPKLGTDGIFPSVFLAVSAFCNAGFDVLGFEGAFVSLCNYNSNPVVILTISLLIIIGGLGFSVWSDLAAWRKRRTLMLHTRVVLLMSAVLLGIGAVGMLLFEWSNPATLGSLGFGEKLSAAFFQSVAARTAGFASIDVAATTGISKLLLIALMFIGASPGSTGGGIKTTTFAVLLMTVFCVARGQGETTIRKRRVAPASIYRALFIVTFGICIVALVSIALYFGLATTVPVSGIDAVFETVSAFATVGTSVGVTAVLNGFGKVLLMICMFLGRVGPVSFVLSLSLRTPANRRVIAPEGRIMVG